MSHDEIRVAPYEVEAIQNESNEIPYGVRMIEAPSLWEKGIDGDGVVVAVLDTGCDNQHPDLRNQIIDGKNFTSDANGNPNDYNDLNGHGTHVAGTIAGSLDGKGVVGVAPKAKLLILKVLGDSGGGRYEWIINAIHYAINWKGPNGEKVRVINMSLGGPSHVPELHSAIRQAVDRDIAVVVAAGNEGDNDENTFEMAYPATYNEVIEIGAIDQLKKIAGFSNVNIELDAVCPGVDILSTYPNGKYARLNGTSMAAPHAAGALALLAQLNDKAFQRKLTEAELYAQLIKNTVPMGYRKSTEGNGLVKLSVMEQVKTLINFIRQPF